MSKITPTQENYYAYLKTPQWETLRRHALERDGQRCRICNSAKFLHVHHRKYPKVYGEESVSDLTTLCSACHDTYHLFKSSSAATKTIPKKKSVRKKSLTLKNSFNAAVSLLVKEGIFITRNGIKKRDAADAICNIAGASPVLKKDMNDIFFMYCNGDICRKRAL
jgi:hypothetical protein